MKLTFKTSLERVLVLKMLCVFLIENPSGFCNNGIDAGSQERRGIRKYGIMLPCKRSIENNVTLHTLR